MAEKEEGKLRVTAGGEGVEGCKDRIEASECEGDDVLRVVRGEDGGGEGVRWDGEGVWRVM